MTNKQRIDKLSRCFRDYLGGRLCEDMKPIDGYEDKFFDGVLWAFARLTEIYPGDDQGE